MRTGPRGRYLRSLAVVDVDVDTGEIVPHLQLTSFETPPEGVYAVVWSGGVPVADVTVRGRPEDVLPELLSIATDRAVHVSRAPSTSGQPTGVLSGADVTVAVCTRDRAEDLVQCLKAIGALATDVAEVLVIDNASEADTTRQVVARFPFARYVREPRAGLDWARNRALLEARTAVVAFTDDDALVHPGWVDGLIRGFTEVPGTVVVAGLVIPLELSTAAQVVFEARGFGRGYARRVFRSTPGVPAGREHAALGDAGTGADMAVMRVPVLGLGGFDPALDVGTPTGGAGDHELFFRVIAAGHALVYEPSAVVMHRHRTTMPGLARQRRGDGTGSYSWWLGAGRRYGRRQYAGLRRQAVRWALRHHLTNVARSLLYPELFPPALSWADARGAAEGATGGLYRRALRQAAAQSAAHPGEPTAPPLVHPRA
ncbi:glycosyltransferase [Modestobacter muralis]|uniref:Glycosyltransferase n=1 Tax=Modestobacter muralis TaxID=1608614 RepID=A0A6P0EV38_9ACTN|nr:glycosyltransferase [Modestobacter muralis]NEK94476.1 glycosyltransferase [Modestobacter muralis]NEN51364.1 glycosyltransferase [Modestobacter muralis]